jgi:hypothetical protein
MDLVGCHIKLALFLCACEERKEAMLSWLDSTAKEGFTIRSCNE